MTAIEPTTIIAVGAIPPLTDEMLLIGERIESTFGRLKHRRLSMNMREGHGNPEGSLDLGYKSQ